LVIATKGGNTRPGPGQWVPDGRPEYLAQAVDKSLKRLKLERIGSRRIGKSRRRMEGQRHDYFDQGNASHWLHFQHLDWERDWLLHWLSESKLSHHRRPYYRNGDFYSLIFMNRPHCWGAIRAIPRLKKFLVRCV